MTQDEYTISVQDVLNVISEHMASLDQLWPDSEIHGARKVHIVELIDGIKLGLIKRAEKNINKYESPFEKAAKKITGTGRDFAKIQATTDATIAGTPSKTAMQLAHEAAQARMKR